MSIEKTGAEKLYEKFSEHIEGYQLTGNDVLRIFVAWNGTQIMTPQFEQYLKDEGYLEDEEEEEEEEE